jgi:hypothetical protein
MKYQNTNLIFEKHYFYLKIIYRLGFPLFTTPARLTGGGGTDL